MNFSIYKFSHFRDISIQYAEAQVSGPWGRTLTFDSQANIRLLRQLWLEHLEQQREIKRLLKELADERKNSQSHKFFLITLYNV